jgi:DNA polymerase I-like protein with 3'-5' exonuclease and polymerase domains
MVSFCDREGNQQVFRWFVDPARGVHPNECQLDFLRQIVENPGITKVFHNAEFDLRHLAVVHGIRVQGPIADTMFMARVARNLENSYKLKDLSARYADIPNDDEKELKKLVIHCRAVAKQINKCCQLGTRKVFELLCRKEKLEPVYGPDSIWDAGGIALGSVVEEDYWLPNLFWPKDGTCEKYCLLDTKRTMTLWELYSMIIEEDPHFKQTLQTEMELWPVTWEMRERGVAVRLDVIAAEQTKAAVQMEEQLDILRQHSWQDFNPNSDPQRIRLFSDELGFKPTSFTD